MAQTIIRALAQVKGATAREDQCEVEAALTQVHSCQSHKAWSRSR